MSSTSSSRLCNCFRSMWTSTVQCIVSQDESVRRRRRLLLGIVVLLMVDVLWVGSSELTDNEPTFEEMTDEDISTSRSAEVASRSFEIIPRPRRVTFSSVREVRQLSETKVQDFSRTQNNFSRTLVCIYQLP
ncbi:unnamed protein product [Porites lobata]|uniref:Uncharacterized protein n=1 Tax=Porites lobata TaxID=104759 RepID=A0ABN8R8C5_9CNID|nr:unnamed protein product [Porites lobata]